MNINDSHVQVIEDCLKNREIFIAECVGRYMDFMKDFATDIEIICRDIILPGHKYILSLRCEALSKILSSGVNQLDWNAYESDIGIALLRWFYTDETVSANDTVTLGLLRASHDFGLSSLFEACVSKLLPSINEMCSPDFYEIAKEVNATMLTEKYLQFRTAPVDDVKNRTEEYKGERLDSLASRDCDLGRFDVVSREKLISLLKRHDQLDENWMKLDRSLAGVSEYMQFYDNRIWGGPVHTFVLLGRSERFRGHSPNVKFMLSQHNERALRRWLYTDEICLDSVGDALALLQFSDKYDMKTLFERCEQAVIDKLCLSSCVDAHFIATRINATKILERVERTVNVYWGGGIKSELFNDVVDTNDSEKVNAKICELPQEKTEAVTLLMLNDDCLLHLFHFVSLVDLGSIKGTCKRLHELADQSFKLYRDKSLTITRGSMMADIWNLKHFGKSLEYLNFEDLYEKYCSSADIFQIIGRFSNEHLNEISLNFYDRNVTEENLVCLQNVLKNVKSITLTDCDGWLVEFLLSFCENLSKIYIDCEEVQLNTLWCSRHSNVKYVTLRGLHNDKVLEEICDELVHLEYLTFNIPDRHEKLNHLTKLNNLKSLTIEFNDTDTLSDVVTPLLQNLATKNVLENLCVQVVSNRCHMTESTALAICNFSRLEVLEIGSVTFNEDVINILSDKLKVEKLSFRYCKNISFEDITKIVEENFNLNVLKVDRCGNIESIDRQNYLRLRKKRNLQIFLDVDVFKKTIKLLANDLSDSVKIVAIID